MSHETQKERNAGLDAEIVKSMVARGIPDPEDRLALIDRVGDAMEALVGSLSTYTDGLQGRLEGSPITPAADIQALRGEVDRCRREFDEVEGAVLERLVEAN